MTPATTRMVGLFAFNLSIDRLASLDTDFGTRFILASLLELPVGGECERFLLRRHELRLAGGFRPPGVLRLSEEGLIEPAKPARLIRFPHTAGAKRLLKVMKTYQQAVPSDALCLGQGVDFRISSICWPSLGGMFFIFKQKSYRRGSGCGRSRRNPPRLGLTSAVLRSVQPHF